MKVSIVVKNSKKVLGQFSGGISSQAEADDLGKVMFEVLKKQGLAETLLISDVEFVRNLEN